MLLHDDGTRLLAYELSGRSRVLWRHPRADVTQMAASPDGEQLAYVVALAPKTKDEVYEILYLLDRDGSIRVVDAVTKRYIVESPVFVRPANTRRVGARLHWIRLGDKVSRETGRIDSEAMVLGDDGAAKIDMVLRYREAVFQLRAYPGAEMFAITLFRTDNAPTRLEVLTTDFGAANADSETKWGSFTFEANTDAFTGAAWLTPTEFVLPVVQESHGNDYSLRRYRLGCEYDGAREFYRGTRIGWGSFDAPWNTLALGTRRVLVLSGRSERAVAEGKTQSARWLSVDVRSGLIKRTGVVWRRDEGPRAWTVVREERPHKTIKVLAKSCTGFRTYP
jgi:hypothetical protein